MKRYFRSTNGKQRRRDPVSRLALESLENRMVLATFFVTNSNDAGPGSLRQAIGDANALTGPDTIEFTAVTNVTLTSGQLTITDSVAIDGSSAGASKVTVERSAAAPAFRVFSVNDGTSGTINVSMNNLRIRNGDARDEADTGTAVSKRGGGVDSTENLTLTNSIVTGNFARRGGGISHRTPDGVGYTRGGTLTIDNTDIVENVADYTAYAGRGGAISSIFAGTLTITNSRINNNSASYMASAMEVSVSIEAYITDTEINGNVNLPNSAGSRSTLYFSQFQNVSGPDTSVVMERVTVENNVNNSTTAEIFGAVHVTQNASLLMRDVAIRNSVNMFGLSGWVVDAQTNLTVERSTISGNDAGGVSINFYGTGNTAMNISDSTISNNGLGPGAGLYGYGLLVGNPGHSSIRNSTISGNQTQGGGGGMEIYVSGTAGLQNPTVDIVSTTITQNTAHAFDGGGRGGGLNISQGLSLDLQLRNSIVSGNVNSNPVGAAADIYDYGYYYGGVATTTAHFSLIGDNSYSGIAEGNPDPNGNIVGGPTGGVINAMLGALANNGGPTLTHLPQAGSPVINRGDNSISGCDQRGFSRPGGAGVDIGSVESDGVPCASPLNLDFNLDGLYNCDDMNLLEQAIDSGVFNVAFDVNSDGVLNTADVFQWLLDAGEIRFGSGRFFRQGDANLDGAVDGSDFGIWNAAKFTATDRWCQGDFNQDNSVDGSDFGIWNANKFTSSDAGRGGDQNYVADAADRVFGGQYGNGLRRAKPAIMVAEGDVRNPVVQMRPTVDSVATIPIARIAQSFATPTVHPRAAEPIAVGHRLSLTDAFAQSRARRQDAHDEAMKLFDEL